MISVVMDIENLQNSEWQSKDWRQSSNIDSISRICIFSFFFFLAEHTLISNPTILLKPEMLEQPRNQIQKIISMLMVMGIT